MPKPDLGLHCWPRPVCPKIKDHYGNITGLDAGFQKGGFVLDNFKQKPEIAKLSPKSP